MDKDVREKRYKEIFMRIFTFGLMVCTDSILIYYATQISRSTFARVMACLGVNYLLMIWSQCVHESMDYISELRGGESYEKEEYRKEKKVPTEFSGGNAG